TAYGMKKLQLGGMRAGAATSCRHAAQESDIHLCESHPRRYKYCYHNDNDTVERRNKSREETKICRIATIVSPTKKTAWPSTSRRARRSAVNPKRMPSGSA